MRPKAYVPIDISGDYLEASAKVVDDDHARIAVHPVIGDFSKPVTLPAEIDGLERLGFFPGSTIGNFVPKSARQRCSVISAISSAPARSC